MTSTYQIIHVQHQRALFSTERIKRSNKPDGLWLYQIRHSDEGFEPATIEESVMVNHYGSLLTKEPLSLNAEGYLEIDDHNWEESDTWQSLDAFLA